MTWKWLTAIIIAVGLIVPSAPAVAATNAPIAVARTNAGIELYSPTGQRIAILTRHRGWVDTDPAWSPDGKRIAFTRTTDGNRSSRVYVMRSDGSAVRRITAGRFDWRPQWSRDGRWIVFQSVRGIERVRPDGTGTRLIPTPDQEVSWPSWTPDGRISYAWHAESLSGWVWTSLLNGTDRHRVVKGRDAHWSPDGQTVVFTPPDGGVATIAASGGASRSLGRGYEANWSPDGNQIVFARMGLTAAGDSTWIMNRDGSSRKLLSRSVGTPEWRPR
jgi:TolB protein